MRRWLQCLVGRLCKWSRGVSGFIRQLEDPQALGMLPRAAVGWGGVFDSDGRAPHFARRREGQGRENLQILWLCINQPEGPNRARQQVPKCVLRHGTPPFSLQTERQHRPALQHHHWPTTEHVPKWTTQRSSHPSLLRSQSPCCYPVVNDACNPMAQHTPTSGTGRVTLTQASGVRSKM